MHIVMKKSTYFLLLLGAATFPLLSCATKPSKPSSDAPYFNWIQPARPDSALTGKASFWPTQEGEKAQIELVLTGAIPKKKYFIQIHEKGNCSEQGLAAGNVYGHGKSTWLQRPIGYLGSLKSNHDGTAEFQISGSEISFGGLENNIAGKSLVISEDKAALIRAGCTIIPVPQ